MSTLIYLSDCADSPSRKNRLYLRLRRGELVKICPGVFMEASEWNQLESSDQYFQECLAVSHSHTLTGRSLMTLLGLPVWPAPEEIDVAQTSDSHCGKGLILPSGRRLRVHQWKGPLQSYQPDLTAVPFERALLTAATRMAFASAVVLFDGYLRMFLKDVPERGKPAAVEAAERRKAELLGLLESSNLRLGRPTARAALTLASPLIESVGESRSRVIFHEGGLPAPVLQQTITLPDGTRFRPDFLWPELKIIGEFDGVVKYGKYARPGESPQDVAVRERRREKRLQQMGYTVVRWDWKDVSYPRRILGWLAEAGLQ